MFLMEELASLTAIRYISCFNLLLTLNFLGFVIAMLYYRTLMIYLLLALRMSVIDLS